MVESSFPICTLHRHSPVEIEPTYPPFWQACVLSHTCLSPLLPQLYKLFSSYFATSIPSTLPLILLFHTCLSPPLTLLAVSHRAICLVETMLQTLLPVEWWDLQVSKVQEYTNSHTYPLSVSLSLSLSLWQWARRHLIGIATVIGSVCCQAENPHLCFSPSSSIQTWA